MTTKQKLTLAGIIVLLLLLITFGSYKIGQNDGLKTATLTKLTDSAKVAQAILKTFLVEKAISDKESERIIQSANETIKSQNDTINSLHSRKFVTAQTVRKESSAEQAKQIAEIVKKDTAGTLIKILDAPIDSSEIVRLNNIVSAQRLIIVRDSIDKINCDSTLFKCLTANRLEVELNKAEQPKHPRLIALWHKIELPFIWVVSSVATLETAYLYLKNK